MSKIELFDNSVNRKHLTPEEWERFKKATNMVSKDKRMFALIHFHMGCRISEGLNVQFQHIDFSNGCVIFETLKRRKKDIFHQVSIPDDFLEALDNAYDVRMLYKRGSKRKSNSMV